MSVLEMGKTELGKMGKNRAAKANGSNWIRITNLYSIVCEQFQPNPLILNDRRILFFLCLQPNCTKNCKKLRRVAKLAPRVATPPAGLLRSTRPQLPAPLPPFLAGQDARSGLDESGQHLKNRHGRPAAAVTGSEAAAV
jgi:hypothetical protein